MLEDLVKAGRNILLGGMIVLAPFIYSCKKAGPAEPSPAPTPGGSSYIKIQCHNVDNGLPEQGVNLDVYDSSVYNTSTGIGNLDFIIVKETPDAVTDSNGFAEIQVSSGSFHVLCHKDGKQKGIKYNVPDSSTNTRNAEVKDGTDGDVVLTMNVVHQENFDENNELTGNKYAAGGDKVKFRYHGNNKDSIDHPGTFLIERQSAPKQIVYYGSLTNTLENIVMTKNDKTWKTIDWPVPVGYSGKYKVYTSLDGTTKHKMGGVFFVVSKTKSPIVNIIEDNFTTYTEQPHDLWWSVTNPPEDGSVRASYFDILPVSSNNIEVNYKGITSTTSSNPFQVSFSNGESGNHTVIINHTDGAGLTGQDTSNGTVYVNDQYAYDLMKPIIESRTLGTVQPKDTETNTTSPVTGTYDIYAPGVIRLEYRSSENGLLDTTDFDPDEWNQVLTWTSSNHSNAIRGIDPSNKDDLLNKLDNILDDLGY